MLHVRGALLTRCGLLCVISYGDAPSLSALDDQRGVDSRTLTTPVIWIVRTRVTRPLSLCSLTNSTDIRTWRSLAGCGSCSRLWHPRSSATGACRVSTKAILPVRTGLWHAVHGGLVRDEPQRVRWVNVLDNIQCCHRALHLAWGSEPRLQYHHQPCPSPSYT